MSTKEEEEETRSGVKHGRDESVSTEEPAQKRRR